MTNQGINQLLGKTLSSVVVADDKEEIIFTTTENERYRMFHCQDCCENVSIEDINGNLEDLIGQPILLAEETSSRDEAFDLERSRNADSFTWTFYKLATTKGYVDIRWFGESNGCYSESVEVYKITLD
jgi:hypothetical protein